jgi:MarR family protein
MTNILHELERRGLVERLPDPSDRRGVLIRLTAEAAKLIEAAIEAHAAEEHRMIGALAPRERKALQSLIAELLISIEPVTTAPAIARAKERPARRAAGRSGSIPRRVRRR